MRDYMSCGLSIKIIKLTPHGTTTSRNKNVIWVSCKFEIPRRRLFVFFGFVLVLVFFFLELYFGIGDLKM